MIDQDLIDRYLKGLASTEDLHLLQEALVRGDLDPLKEKMGKDWDTLADTIHPQLSKSIWQEVKSKTIDSERQRREARRRRLRMYWAAASVVLIIGVGLGSYWSWQQAPIEHITGFATWKTVVLPDGSKVQLNANSSLSFDRHWPEGEDRRVNLNGEAFFQVEKKPTTNAKFSVVTDDLTVEVLGTAFNVNSRGEQTKVFLEEGSIKLKLAKGQTEYMRPGEYISFSKKQNAILSREESVSEDQHASWKDGVLIIKDRPGDEILEKIEEIYGVTVDVDNRLELKGNKTVSIPMDKLEVAIPLLEGCFEAKIVQGENSLKLIP